MSASGAALSKLSSTATLSIIRSASSMLTQLKQGFVSVDAPKPPALCKMEQAEDEILLQGRGRCYWCKYRWRRLRSSAGANGDCRYEKRRKAEPSRI